MYWLSLTHTTHGTICYNMLSIVFVSVSTDVDVYTSISNQLAVWLPLRCCHSTPSWFTHLTSYRPQKFSAIFSETHTHTTPRHNKSTTTNNRWQKCVHRKTFPYLSHDLYQFSHRFILHSIFSPRLPFFVYVSVYVVHSRSSSSHSHPARISRSISTSVRSKWINSNITSSKSLASSSATFGHRYASLLTISPQHKTY